MFRSILLAALLSCSLFAQDTQPVNQRLTTLEPVYPCHLFLTGDLLFWKAEENGLPYVIKTNDPFQLLTNETQKIRNLHFTYDLGFRVGMGYTTSHDAWDLYLNWTRFHTEVTSQTFTRHQDGLFAIWSSFTEVNALSFIHAKSHWKLNFDMIDGEVGRRYHVGKWLSLRPSLGVRTAWIRQKNTILYDTFFTDVIFEDINRQTNNFGGIGPKLSLETIWGLPWGLSVFGSGTCALLYGNFELKKHEIQEGTSPHQLRSHDHFQLVRGMADLQIGISWERVLIRDRLQLQLRAAWEEMIFFGQNQFYRLANSASQGSILSNLGDLSFQGGTFSVRLDF